MAIKKQIMQSLQSIFCKTLGGPVHRDGLSIMQIDTIPFSSGCITIRFLSPARQSPVQGVRFNAGKNGYTNLTDGPKAEVLYVWHEPTLPTEVTYDIVCPSGELTICNIYRISHKTGLVTEDRWTGNAGLIIKKSTEGRRLYGCSDGLGEFDPENLEFEIIWER